MIAQTNAAAETGSATINHAQDLPVAHVKGDYDVEVATIQVENQLLVAQTNAAAEETVAITKANADIQGATLSASASTYGSDQSRIASEYGADHQLLGTQYTADTTTKNLNIKLAWAQEKWNLVWPFVESTFSSANGKIDPASAYASDGGDGWVSSVLRADFRIYGAANSAAAQCGVLQDLAERKQQDEVSGDRSSGSRILIEFADTQCDQARVRRLWNHEYR